MLAASVRINGGLVPASTDLPADSIFPIYSITKTLTAICVLRMVDAGAFGLDDTVKAQLCDLGIPDTITIRHLLRHSSGLRDYGPLPEYHDAVRTTPLQPWTRQQFLDSTIPRGLLFAPGSGFSYSNVGYMLLVDILERTSGETFAAIVATNIVSQLKLTHTAVAETAADLMRCVPGFGSEVTADATVVDVRGRYHPGWCAPRLVTSTTAEITAIFDGLIAGSFFRSETLAQMLATVPLSTAADEEHAAGLGIYADISRPWGGNYGHSGGGPGYNTSASVLPSSSRGRVATAVFVNDSASPSALDCNVELLGQVFATTD